MRRSKRSDPCEQSGEALAPPDRDEVDSPDDLDDLDDPATNTQPREPAELEALLARTVVVETPEAWSRWCQHDRPQVLIPPFYPDNVTEAVAAGHHVVLPRVARDANDTGRLSRFRTTPPGPPDRAPA